MKSRAIAIGVALVAIAAGSPAAAGAATLSKVSKPGGTYHLVYTAAPGENNHLAVGEMGAVIRFQGTVPMTPLSLGCSDAPATPQLPESVQCDSTGVTRLELKTGDGKNEVFVSGHIPATVTGVGGSFNSFNGGQGKDVLVGWTATDNLDGGFGDDRVIGGDGDDNLAGGPGADELRGELGNDSLSSGMDIDGDDVLGGAGVDTAVYSGRSADISISMDGVANDGAPGEGDNVGTDMERVLGGSGNDRIVAQAGLVANQVYGGDGDDVLQGGGGGDWLEGGPGSDSISAGSGLDKLRGQGGDDDLAGGPDRDSLEAGDGDDVMAGGPGRDGFEGGAGVDRVTYAASSAGVTADADGEKGDDGVPGELDGIGADVEELVGSSFADTLSAVGGVNRIEGGAGDDRMLSADGVADSVDCGDGRDTAQADPVDTLANCDIDAPKGGGEATGAAGGVRIGPARVRLTERGVARLRVTCSAGSATACKGTLRIRRKIAGKTRTIGKHRFSVASGQRAVVRVRVARSVRVRMTKAGLRVRVVARPAARYIRILPQARSGRSG